MVQCYFEVLVHKMFSSFKHIYLGFAASIYCSIKDTFIIHQHLILRHTDSSAINIDLALYPLNMSS